MKANGAKAMNSSSPIFDHFVWHRLVVDEGHEVLRDWLSLRMLCGLKARHRWYVTGTPFPTQYDIIMLYFYCLFVIDVIIRTLCEKKDNSVEYKNLPNFRDLSCFHPPEKPHSSLIFIFYYHEFLFF